MIKSPLTTPNSSGAQASPHRSHEPVRIVHHVPPRESEQRPTELQQAVLPLPIAVQRARRVVHGNAIELQTESTLRIGGIKASYELVTVEHLVLSDRQHNAPILQGKPAGGFQDGFGTPVSLSYPQLDHTVASPSSASRQRLRDLTEGDDPAADGIVDGPHGIESGHVSRHVEQRSHRGGDRHSITKFDVTERKSPAMTDQLASPNTSLVASDGDVLRPSPVRCCQTMDPRSRLVTGDSICHAGTQHGSSCQGQRSYLRRSSHIHATLHTANSSRAQRLHDLVWIHAGAQRSLAQDQSVVLDYIVDPLVHVPHNDPARPSDVTALVNLWITQTVGSRKVLVDLGLVVLADARRPERRRPPHRSAGALRSVSYPKEPTATHMPPDSFSRSAASCSSEASVPPDWAGAPTDVEGASPPEV